MVSPIDSQFGICISMETDSLEIPKMKDVRMICSKVRFRRRIDVHMYSYGQNNSSNA